MHKISSQCNLPALRQYVWHIPELWIMKHLQIDENKTTAWMPEGSCKCGWSFRHHLMKNASRTLKWCNYRVLSNFWFQWPQSVILPSRVYTDSLIYFQEFSSYCILQVWLLLLASVEKWKSASNVMHSVDLFLNLCMETTPSNLSAAWIPN
jgi:hypothetical protein